MRIIHSVNTFINPRWYLGHVYYDYERDKCVMAIVPLNWILLLWHRIAYSYFKLARKQSWIDRHVKAAIKIRENRTQR